MNRFFPADQQGRRLCGIYWRRGLSVVDMIAKSTFTPVEPWVRFFFFVCLFARLWQPVIGSVIIFAYLSFHNRFTRVISVYSPPQTTWIARFEPKPLPATLTPFVLNLPLSSFFLETLLTDRMTVLPAARFIGSLQWILFSSEIQLVRTG